MKRSFPSGAAEIISKDSLMGVSYSTWSANTFKSRIAPLIEKVTDPPLAAECGPGPDAGRYRLYPGSLLLLWAQAIGGPEADIGAEPLAAALELLHNSSLVHDDVLDGHGVRHGQSTLFGSQGHNSAVLAGDSLMASAIRVLSQMDSSCMPGVLARIAEAVVALITGQMNDEPEVWQQVENRWKHWLVVCSQKLAIGNVSSSLAAFWCSRLDLEAEVRRVMDQFSVVSQILNDFGDLFNFAGYHEVSVSGRPRGEEASRKPTLPLIWAEVDHYESITDIRPLKQRAKEEIERRRTEAIAGLGKLSLHADCIPVLIDFFSRPSLPEFE